MFAPVSRHLLVALALSAIAFSSTALAKGTKAKGRKLKPAQAACGLTYLPFTPGAHWTYEAFVPEDAEAKKGIVIDEPKALMIRVSEIKQVGPTTVIVLEESYRKRVVETELRCDKAGLTVSPDSFFFFGEPGGGIGMTLTNLVRDGIEYPGKPGLVTGGEHTDDLKAGVTRAAAEGSGATLAPATLELERKAVVGVVEEVESKLGAHKATRVEIELAGRANLADQAAEKPLNMPDAKVKLWFAPKVGVVRVESSLGRGWKLSEFSDGSDEAAPAP